MKNRFDKFIKLNWGKILLAVILLVLVGTNFKWGYFILGNDNYSPEVNPWVAGERLAAPAWRNYRALGVASDADQADLIRVVAANILKNVVPLWFLNQSFIFFCLVVGSWSMGALTKLVLSKLLKQPKSELMFLLGGLFYLGNLLAMWLFYSPLIPFITVWSFLPLVLWLATTIALKGSIKYYLGWWAVLLLVSISGIVPTIFIVETGVVLWWLGSLALWTDASKKRLAVLVIMYFLSQLFWLLPFAVYVKTNSAALQDSFINRKLTPEMIENEAASNQLLNVPRYLASWFQAKNDDNSWWFSQRSWYQNLSVTIMGYWPVVLLGLGSFWLAIKKKWFGVGLAGLYFIGWFLIKGVNPPFGSLYTFLQKNIPLFEQVFRWQSSKIWPLMIIPLPMVVSYLLITVVNKKKMVGWIISGMTVGILLVYVYPALSGKLINRGNYVKIPNEYYQLAEWIKTNGLETKRIYLAPEANTLYFRNYKWGFFGSSIVNYLIPNPIVEKAMTTGSLESEAAQKVVQQAFYSNKPELLTNAMARYKIDWLLLDKSANRQANGYDYNWDTAELMVEKNPNLTKIWTDGFLSLYANTVSLGQKWEEVVNGHDWQKMGEIKTFLASTSNYVTGTKGALYPLAWKYDEVAVDKDAIVLSGSYQGETQQLTVDWGKGEAAGPYKINWNNRQKQIELLPVLPEIRLGGTLINKTVNVSETIVLPQQPAFVSYTDQVMPLNDETAVSNKSLADLKSQQAQWWSSESNKENIVLIKDERPYWVADKDTIVKVEITTQLEKATEANLCVWSEEEGRCLSEVVSGTIKSGQQNNVWLVPKVIYKDEKLTFYLNDAAGQPVAMKSLVVEQFSQKLTTAAGENVLGENQQVITLNKGDLIQLTLPIIQDGGWWTTKGDNGWGPEIANQNCGQSGYSDVAYQNNGEVEFRTKNCWGGIYSKHQLIQTEGGIGTLFYRAENSSGIPLDLSIKSDKGNYPWLEERIGYQKVSNNYAYVILPDEWKSYYVNVAANGIGPRESSNTLNEMAFEFLPKSWLNIALRPVKDETIVWPTGINQAVSDSWYSADGQKVTINGWEQGWTTAEAANKAIFWPNYLVRLGYAILILEPLSISAIAIKKKRGAVAANFKV